MKKLISHLFLGSLLMMTAPTIHDVAAEESASEPKVELELDLQKFQQTKVGGKIIQLAKDKADEEIENATNGDGGWKNIVDAAGFDPLSEIQSITASSNNPEQFKDDLLVVVQMKSTTGNLEGLVLGAPGYAASEYNGHTIYSAEFEEGEKVSATILDGAAKRIVLSTNEDQVKEFIDSAKDSPSDTSLAASEGFLRISINEIPSDLIEEGPPANLAKLVRRVSVLLSENGDELTVQLTLGMHDEKQAEQVRQMVEGLRAMADLFKSEIDDEHAKKVADVVKSLEITKEGTEVSTEVALPNEVVWKFLREEADFQL